MTLKISNTLSGKTEEFSPQQPGKVKMYVCGVTVYASSHIGHAMSALSFDVIRRYLEYRGYNVEHIINFTDIDDKIIRRALEEGRPWQDLTEQYVQEYLSWMDALNVRRATAYPRATQEVEHIVEAIQTLIDKGYAYAAANGDVYYEVAKKADYGELKHQSLDELKAGARIEIGEEKKSPLDFALWKAAKPGEPSWPSPWGAGRPGWHIECSVMSMHYLGDQLDIHGGGNDLIFPHHENEIAQSEALTGVRPFARYWVHNGMLQAKAWDAEQSKWVVEKMSKSLGNTLSVGKLLEMGDQDMLRMFVLGSHYAKPLTYTDDSFEVALKGLERLKKVFEPSEKWPDSIQTSGNAEATSALEAATAASRRTFEEAMDSDFNTSQALAALYDLVREIFKGRDNAASGASLHTARETLAELGGVLGFRMKELPQAAGLTADQEAALQSYLGEVLVQLDGDTAAGFSPTTTGEELIGQAVRLRTALKTAKQYQQADALRSRLKDLGITLEDRKGGETTWRFEK